MKLLVCYPLSSVFRETMCKETGSPVRRILVKPLSGAFGGHEDPGVGVAEGGEEVELAAGWLQKAEQFPVLFPPCQACNVSQVWDVKDGLQSTLVAKPSHQVATTVHAYGRLSSTMSLDARHSAELCSLTYKAVG